MEIITRIPPAYFIPIESDGIEPFRWINLAHVQSIDVLSDVLSIYLDGNQKLILSGDRAEKFLQEIQSLNARYRV